MTLLLTRTGDAQVDHVLFRVHRYFFERESPIFRDKLTTPASPGQPAQGTSDSNAIVLEVHVAEFEKMLWVFYNPFVIARRGIFVD